MTAFDASTPFILIARITVKEGKVSEYLELAARTDSAVQASEPGMIHHTFDQDPDSTQGFTWSEVYKDDSAFLAHLANPPVVEYLSKHAEIGDSFSVEVYGTVGLECRNAMFATGLPFKIYESKCGYSRV